MADYGFTGADIASISNAREGLVQGFMQLGKQIQVDIERIAVTRQLKGFSQELSNLDPTDDAFPQRLIQTMSRYPLAANTPMARNGIELLGAKYRATQYAKNQVGSTVGQFIETVDAEGNPVRKLVNRRTGSEIGEFPLPEKDVRGTIVNTPEGQKLINPMTGDTIENLGMRPGAARIDPILKAKMDQVESDRDALLKRWEKLKTAYDAAGNKDKPAIQAEITKAEADIESARNVLKSFTDEAEKSIRRAPPALSGSGGVTQQDTLPLMPNPQSGSNFVPMDQALQNMDRAVIGVPNPKQMTLNQDGGAVMPDNLPVLPGVKPSPTQAGTPRLYQKDPSGRLLFSKTRPKEAVQQAFSDQVITEEQFQGYMGKLQ